MATNVVIRLVRHGESEANIDLYNPQERGDHKVPLTSNGKEQARQRGIALSEAGAFENCLAYCSPYKRTRETLAAILDGAKLSREQVKIYEDPRLREVDHGYSDDVDQQQDLRGVHGYFYYRYKGGESPADCYDRTSTFMESMMRQVERKSAQNVLVVTHGITIRCFAMRFVHLTVEQYEDLDNPGNCDVVEIANIGTLGKTQFRSGSWGVKGLRFR